MASDEKALCTTAFKVGVIVSTAVVAAENVAANTGGGRGGILSCSLSAKDELEVLYLRGLATVVVVAVVAVAL